VARDHAARFRDKADKDVPDLSGSFLRLRDSGSRDRELGQGQQCAYQHAGTHAHRIDPD